MDMELFQKIKEDIKKLIEIISNSENNFYILSCLLILDMTYKKLTFEFMEF